MENEELLKSLATMLNELQYKDETKLDALKRRSEMIIRKIFGESNKYLNDLKYINFHPSFAPSEESDRYRYWNSGKNKMNNLLSTMIEEIKLFGENSQNNNLTKIKSNNLNQIFLVHGHDEALKQSVARLLEKMKLNPIILHEQPNEGKTIIEKFTDYSNVPYAIVLLSPDDMAYPKNNKSLIKSRARQNVIFELGYFIGKLGRHRVMILYKQEKDFEFPSDYQGVIYTLIDEHDGWKTKMVKELKNVGYNIDANSII